MLNCGSRLTMKLALKLYSDLCFFYLFFPFAKCESLSIFTFILPVESVQKSIAGEKPRAHYAITVPFVSPRGNFCVRAGARRARARERGRVCAPSATVYAAYIK